MGYSVNFGQIVEYIPYLLGGAWFSLQIAFLAYCGGMVIGLVGAIAKTFGGRFLARLAHLYVVFVTNTPQLVQIYFLYFALPEAGIVMSSYQAVLLAMTINAGAYLTEIQRAGFMSVRQTEMEAAETLGMSLLQQVRYVILPHIARVLFPPLSNHYILMTLGTMIGAFGTHSLEGKLPPPGARHSRVLSTGRSRPPRPATSRRQYRPGASDETGGCAPRTNPGRRRAESGASR